MSLSFAVSISVYMAAARCRPESEPVKIQLPLQTAMPLTARSAALFEIQMRLKPTLAVRTMLIRWDVL